MADGRSLDDVFSDLEEAQYDIARLALAVDAIGSKCVSDVTVGRRYAGAVEVLGEVIQDRAQRLADLLAEGEAIRRTSRRG